MIAESENSHLVKSPILRIAPPSGWFDLNLGEMWQYRELLYFFVWRDIKIRYKQTVVGAAWAVFQPLMTMAVFSLFFGKLAKMPSNGLPYPVFYFSALLPWTYFSGALQNATNVVVEQQRVITKVYFPRLVLPLSAVVAGLVDFSIGFVVFLVMMAYYRIVPSLPIFFFPLFLLMAVLPSCLLRLQHLARPLCQRGGRSHDPCDQRLDQRIAVRRADVTLTCSNINDLRLRDALHFTDRAQQTGASGWAGGR